MKGCLPHTKRKESAGSIHSGGTISVDHVSKLIYITNQVNLIAADTLMGKRYFKRFVVGHSVSITQYHSDNDIFKSKLWTEHCGVAGQEPTKMSGIGAHHQNDITERAI
eukprot:8358423-Ditylum_brightwellii.AAC.1